MEEPLCRGTLFAKAGGQGAVCLHGSVAVQILNVRMGLECWTGPDPRGRVQLPVPLGGGGRNGGSAARRAPDSELQARSLVPFQMLLSGSQTFPVREGKKVRFNF